MTDLAESQKIQPVKFSDSALVVLRQYDWPGNYDQLAETVKNIMLESDGKEVDEQAVAVALGQKENATATEIIGGFNFNMPLRELREEVERRYFEYHIAQEGQKYEPCGAKGRFGAYTPLPQTQTTRYQRIAPQRRQIRRISAISVQI